MYTEQKDIAKRQCKQVKFPEAASGQLGQKASEVSEVTKDGLRDGDGPSQLHYIGAWATIFSFKATLSEGVMTSASS